MSTASSIVSSASSQSQIANRASTELVEGNLQISDRRLAANRLNSQKSTGPRSPEGKSKSSQNATTHGLTSSRPILPPDEQQDFDAFLQDTVDDLQPQGAIELSFAKRIAFLFFQLDRAASSEAHLLDRQSTAPIRQTLRENQKELDAYLRNYEDEEQANLKRKHPRLPFPPELQQLPNPIPTHEVLADQFLSQYGGSSTSLERLARYTATLDRQLHRALKQLQTLQKLRADSPKQIEPTEDPTPIPPPSGVVASATTEHVPPSTQEQNEPNSPPSQFEFPCENEPTHPILSPELSPRLNLSS